MDWLRSTGIKAIALVALLAGCYPLHRYNRTDYFLTNRTASAPYRIGFVEFDDQGIKYSQAQLDNVVAHLGTDARKLVVVFAHGWFHNASHDDSNLAFFGEVLGQVAALECAVAKDEQRAPREVFGVFLGWRGDAWRLPIAKYLTFWNRKETAHRVGEREATNALIRIGRAAYQGEQRASSHPTRLMIMGHSFGAGLVNSALSQLVTASLIDGSQTKLADAVVLFNPAFEAARWEPLLKIESSTTPLPKIVALTSKTDRATGWVFPFGRWFNTLPQRSRTVDNPVLGGTFRERRANNQSIGHFTPFITHDLHTIEDASAECPRRAASVDVDPDALRKDPSSHVAQLASAWLDAIRTAYAAGEPMHFGLTCLVPRAELVTRQLNVFNIAVDRAIWDGHAFEQKDARRKRVLSFLTFLVPFMAATPTDADTSAAPAMEYSGESDKTLESRTDALRSVEPPHAARKYAF